MQDHGRVTENSENQVCIRNLASLTRHGQNSECTLLHDVDGTCIDEIDNPLYKQENSTSHSLNRKNLPNGRDLPKIVSSNYENIPLDSAKEVGRISNHLNTEIVRKHDEKCMNSCGENAVELRENISHEEPLKVMEKDKSPNVQNSADSALVQSVFHKSLESSNTDKSPWNKIDPTLEEPSIEDSCESQPVYSRDRNETERSTVFQKPKPRINCTERPPMLSDDSRLVKISLPTNSLNLMQTNTQFLNKSRNFLNFITEKSTNIMEKTLLPQNLANRYNSMIKMTEGAAYTIDKKNSEEIPISLASSMSEVMRTSDPKMTLQTSEMNGLTRDYIISPNAGVKNPPDLKNTEIIAIPESGVSNGFSMNSDASSNINNSISLIQDTSPLRCEISESSNSELKNDEPVSTKSNEIADENSRVKCEQGDSTDPRDVSTNSCNDLLRNPVYLTLVRDYAKARDEKEKLADKVNSLDARNRMLEAQNSGELLTTQLEALEKTVERLTSELCAANSHREELGREYAAANKERESMVMKYAVSEKQLIDTQRARDCTERKYKEIAKDHESLQAKLRQAQNERTRICNILDAKCRELTDSQKEVERLKEDVNVRDVKLKWSQTKLKAEMEGQKETQMKLDKATARINDMKEECEQIRRESQEMIRKFHQSEENKAVTLDQQLKEQQARLILERHVTEDKEMLRLQLQKEVELLKNRQHALIEENNTLSLKIQDLEKNRLIYESRMSELKIIADQRQKEIVDLNAKVSHLETLKLQLIHKEQCLVSNEAEVERLRQVNQDLQADMDCCRQREAHMLDFTQKLTDKNVRLQSEFTSVEARAAQLENEQGPLRNSIVELKTKVKTLEENLSQEKKKRSEECEILAKHLAEQTQLAQNLMQKLEDSQGEIFVLRRKQQISVKEMSRELQQCRKKLEAYESASPSNSLDPTSRTGSNTSLNAGDILNGTSSENGGNGELPRQSIDLDRQSLIDRILKMQKINVRRAEKLDFLEEHTRTLVAELQKKTKIIQNYILHENFDAMGSNERDRHKAELARHGGIMASVYNHRVSDDNMTLELSLEINQKLQAVLEDALLKNITLKDNIDTLGEEIARLSISNQQMLQQKGK